MWAYSMTAPGAFERVEVPAPRQGDLRPGQVLLRMVAGGLCGSDLPLFRGTPLPLLAPGPGGVFVPPPGFPMHEIVGEVVASAGPELDPGDLVVGWADRADALAEFVVTAASSVLDFRRRWEPATAVLLQPLACVLEAVGRIPVTAGADVTVLGQGPIGVLFSHVLKSMGARHVLGVDRVDRGDVADAFGVDEMVRAEAADWAAGLDEKGRRTLVVEAVGHQPAMLRAAVCAAARGGTVYLFGIPDNDDYPFNVNTFLRRDLTLIAGVTRRRAESLTAAAGYLRRHPEIAACVTTVLPVDAVQEAFTRAVSPVPGQLKIVVSAGDR